MKEWKKGDFAYARGRTLVRLSDHPKDDYFGIDYISDYETGAGVTCGGHSSARTAELSIVTDVKDIVICTIYAAIQAAKEAEAEAARQKHRVLVYQAALGALKEARLAEAEAKREADLEPPKPATEMRP